MKISILDHGYLELIESWGSDERIIESARMSTSKGFLGWGPIHDSGCTATNPDIENACTCGSQKPGDEKLLAYLWNHKHHTPFEMAGATIEVQAPIFVFREWHRHRTQSYNELSARYTQMPNLHYVPSAERIRQAGQDHKNRQGSCAIEMTDEDVATIQKRIRSTQEVIYSEYEVFLGVYGLSKELARLNTPVSRYSRMRASANLRNWLAFLTLRMDTAAQWEIRQFANALHDVLVGKFPRTLSLFDAERNHT